MASDVHRPDAFLLFGGHVLFRRHPRLLDAILDRGLKLLVIVEPGVGGAAEIEAAATDPAERLSKVAELRVIPGVDRAAMSEAIHTMASRYRIVGSFCIGEGLVEPAGLAMAMLGLPFPGLLATIVCRNKLLQRRLLAAHSPTSIALLPGQRSEAIASYTDSWPAVLKPAGRFSSSGVVVVESAEDTEARLCDYPHDEVLLLEPRVLGREYSVEALVRGGVVEYLGITEKETNELKTQHFVEMSHTVPAIALGDPTVITNASENVLKMLQFDTGVAHLEWRLSVDGPILMEVAARMPGDGLAMLHTLSTGVSFEEAVVRVALGEPAGYPQPTRWARQRYLAASPGIITGLKVPAGVEVTWLDSAAYWPAIPCLSADAPAEVRAVVMTSQLKASVTAYQTSADRVGWVCLDAPSAWELTMMDAEVQNEISVHTRLTSDTRMQ